MKKSSLISIVISLMGVRLCYFPGISHWVILVSTSRHTTFCCAHIHTQATVIIHLSNYSLTAYSMVLVTAFVSYTCFVSAPVCVSVSLSVCSSTRQAPGNFNCLVQGSQEEDFVGCATRGGWWWRGRGNRGTFPVEMGLSLHQLLLQLQQEACRSLGTKPIGIQMGTHVKTWRKSFLNRHTKSHYRYLLCQDHMVHLYLSRHAFTKY